MNTNQFAINLHRKADQLLKSRTRRESYLFGRHVRECVRCETLVSGRGRVDGQGRRGPATYYCICLECGGDNFQ